MATIDNSYILALGPIKAEVFDLSAVTDADTVTARLQRPTFGFALNVTDGENTALAIGVSISGRTITLNNSSLSSSDVVLVLFGF